MQRALVLGIGGGGDAVGSLAVAAALRRRGVAPVIGGVAWERFSVDPHPGPRELRDVVGARPLGDASALVDPESGATTPEGVPFCEAGVAAHVGEPTVLVDVTGGAAGAARGIAAAVRELGCELVVLVDIGGDAIADGTEPGLASPLCDAVMLAGAAALGPELPAVAGVLGAGCDGELRHDEVLRRVAALARAGAWIGSLSVDAAAASEIERAASVAVTEASLLVARAARGETGEVEIRGGTRRVELGPLAAICFLFDLGSALTELPLVRSVAGTQSIEAAHEALAELGLSTELEYERRRAGEAGATA